MNEKMRVLVVDDEPDIRELLDMTLARMGLECDCAASVAEAREHLRTQSYNLCLTDMRMPDGGGLDIVRLIEADHPALPVAVITAHGSTENAVAALKAGAFDYLSKPVSLAQLRTLVKSALALPEGKVYDAFVELLQSNVLGVGASVQVRAVRHITGEEQQSDEFVGLHCIISCGGCCIGISPPCIGISPSLYSGISCCGISPIRSPVCMAAAIVPATMS